MSNIEWTEKQANRMTQTAARVMKTAAKKAQTSLAEYQSRLKEGQKWCSVCKAWHCASEFGKDRSRWDGLAAGCRKGRNRKGRTVHRPRLPIIKGRAFTPPRDGDRKQARRRINYFVEAKLLPHPNALPCVDCGHIWRQNEKRHEYDHYLGYAAENHEKVQAVCTSCHHARERRRTQ